MTKSSVVSPKFEAEANFGNSESTFAEESGNSDDRVGNDDDDGDDDDGDDDGDRNELETER